MDCCQKCFGCDFLSSHIEVVSEVVGCCSLCGSENVYTIMASSLGDLFTPLIDLYESDDNSGMSLIELIRRDWKLFIEIPSERMNQFFSEITKYDVQTFENYQPVLNDEKIYDWEEFKEELKHENRFFPKSFPKPYKFSELLSYLSVATDHRLKNLYRARINKKSEVAYPIEEMGAPPKNIASSGRANPVGITCLYVASTVKTALSEVRPHKGDLVSIADFSVIERLNLVDLRDPRKSILPFIYSETELRIIYSGLNLLEILGHELTKPISQHKAELEYLSSQYLCEFIKSQGYDGVLYKSSLGDGDNYAIFDEANIAGEGVSVIEVTDIVISHSEFD